MNLCDDNRDHEALKRDPVAWLSLEFVGLQDAYDGRGTKLEMRNCSCGSTLCKTIRLARELTAAEHTVLVGASS